MDIVKEYDIEFLHSLLLGDTCNRQLVRTLILGCSDNIAKKLYERTWGGISYTREPSFNEWRSFFEYTIENDKWWK